MTDMNEQIFFKKSDLDDEQAVENGKYPLATKAVAEQEGIARFVGDTLPEEYYTVMNACMNLIDTHIDGSVEQKEAIMGAVVFACASPFTFDSIDRYETDFSKTFHQLAEFCVTGETENSDIKEFCEMVPIIATLAAMKSLPQSGERPPVLESDFNEFFNNPILSHPLLVRLAPLVAEMKELAAQYVVPDVRGEQKGLSASRINREPS
ncbi:MAG: hypothetical protein WCD70_09205 [Alphaproteobacteria bacterium]